MTKTAPLKRITLNLARSKEYPEGSARHGYDVVAPLDSNGFLDAEAWKASKNLCTVRRYWGSEEEERGLLAHRAGGQGGATWTFDYDAATDSDDEPGFRLESHAMRPGEYVSIRDDDGHLHTFVVKLVKPY